jgi:hypothetical protein
MTPLGPDRVRPQPELRNTEKIPIELIMTDLLFALSEHVTCRRITREAIFNVR